MKRVLVVLITVTAVATIAYMIGSQRESRRYATQLADQQAVWQTEKAELEAALAQARRRTGSPSVAPVLTTPSEPSARLSAKEIIARLQALRVTPGGNPRSLRQAVYWLEELTLMGAQAVPAIREFLARYEDVDLDTSWFLSRGGRDRLPLDFALPPSLRLGLFDVLRQIGGPEAESALVEALGNTGRGVEVAYLARVLQELAPDKYRDQALTVARALLANVTPFNSTSPLDQNHRDHLFAVLSLYGDRGFAGEAQAQLVRADGQIDRSALKYLQQTLGAQAVPIVTQVYDNPLITNAMSKEPLARLALNFVGADSQADEFYQRTINDPILTRSHRKNLIEDLNQDGFADTRNITARDLPLIENRITLIERLAPSAMDEVNAAAFKEAYKDLINMRAKASGVPPPARP